MNIPCPNCGGRFGGHETYARHLLKREDRCKTRGEMRATGLVQDIWGVWKRAGTRTREQAELWDRRQATALRRHRRSATEKPVGVRARAHHADDTTGAQGAAGGTT